MMLVRKIDGLLNGTTMYRLIVYVLSIWIALALAFSFTGVLQYSWTGLGLSLVVAVGSCYLANLVLSWVWNVTTNTESWLITALILCCIMPQATTTARIAGIIVAGCAAMAGKFILAWHGKHVFNPAALGAVVAGMVGLAYAGWWIGTPIMLPFVVIGGLLIVRKIRRFTLVATFIGISLATTAVMSVLQGNDLIASLRLAALSGPLVFLATVMLTEPSTLPPRRSMQLVYAVLTGVLFSTHLGDGIWAVTPHMALLLGNVFSFAVSPKRRLRLQLKAKHQLGPNIYDYEFITETPLAFKPGQYLEWTLPHAHTDDRGNRRTFTIASSPTEKTFHLGVKFYNPSSSFKRALFAMEPGQQLWAGHLTGDFTMPDNPRQKMVWVAGGIGVTPFRSMAQYMVDIKQQRDVVLFYAIADPQEIAYEAVFDEAKKYGLRLVPVLAAKEVPPSWKGLTGFLNPELIRAEVPDYAARYFYLSGPNAMVANYTLLVQKMGVSRRHIVTDYFPGY
jgi:ferredoxin-NADP reductase/Na+-translocating ferredoxin:NAD+ oxidoreductase RnfD subunit